jgi:hypothetical protein
MRKTIAFYVAVLGLIMVVSSASGQNLGETFDPLPEMEGHFVYTTEDWKFIGPITAERDHMLAAAYGDNVPASLNRHVETELGVNSESN